MHTLQLMYEWVKFMHGARHDEELAKRAWAVARPRLEASRTRWQRVRGPLTDALATLVDLGWKPEEPAKWVSASGLLWFLDPELAPTRENVAPVLADLLATLVRKVRSSGSQGRHGKGSEDAPDVVSAKRHIASLKRKCRHQDASLLRTVLVGGLCPRARRHATGLLEDPACPLCGMADQIEHHVIWHCPVVPEGLKEQEEDCGQGKRRQVREHGLEHLALWMRGLATNAGGDIPPWLEEAAVERIGRDQWDPGLLYGRQRG